eukprot:CAMPEP_0194386440 /NCGR_PEP_ID=MMETSP0174-20130528/86372_1 /TAXON_ID=216777 /ORGANISM="Proboscia alata, Strain PI-D3" /LENGTH=300 /DNA_ID=CAMNT_0039175607 /DNA_START=215 /DNA_END=1117 /DNA_ORIENTATION=+
MTTKGPFELAKKQSYGFFDDISTTQWNKLRDLVSHHKDHFDMDDPSIYFSINKGRNRNIKPNENDRLPVEWFQSHYEPNFSCMFKVRVGGNGNGDGPKWVCDPHRLKIISAERKVKNPTRPGCIIYSVGSNGDFSFEEALQSLLGKDSCEIHTFDMDDYQDNMPIDMNIHFHKWGLAHEASVVENDKKGTQIYKTLKETIKELGHDDLPAIDIFKIDCEGCEFETQTDWITSDDNMPMLQQILVEVHMPRAGTVNKFFDSFKNAGYVTFSKEQNIQMPRFSASEYSFLKLDTEFFQVPTE